MSRFVFKAGKVSSADTAICEVARATTARSNSTLLSENLTFFYVIGFEKKSHYQHSNHNIATTRVNVAQ